VTHLDMVVAGIALVVVVVVVVLRPQMEVVDQEGRRIGSLAHSQHSHWLVD